MDSHNVQFEWVKGHAGIDLNERCDELATKAAEGKNLPEDVRPEEEGRTRTDKNGYIIGRGSISLKKLPP